MKNKIVFYGFNTDYSTYDINSIVGYDVQQIIHSKILSFLLLRLRSVNREAYLKLSKYIANKKIKRLTGQELLIIEDNPLYIEAQNVAFKNKIIMCRNTYNKNKFEIDFLNSKVYSFDRNDCLKYNANYYPQYCSAVEILKKDLGEINFEMYFVGLNKGRKTIIEKICDLDKLNKHKVVIFNSETLFDKVKLRLTRVKYLEHLENIKQSNVILDIVKDGQNGVTMRMIEALIAGKKIITNNKYVKNEEIYDPSRILIFDEKTTSSIYENFLASKYVNLDANHIEKYYFQTVIDKIAQENL